jgi:hypothetical protein
MLRIKDPKDFAAGALLILIGVLGYLLVRDLSFGTARRMGPAYVPSLISWAIAVVGLILCARSLVRAGTGFPAWHWRPLLVISAAVLAFGLLIDRAGLAIASASMIVVANLGNAERRWAFALLFALAIAVAASLLFSVLLGLQMSVLPRWN